MGSGGRLSGTNIGYNTAPGVSGSFTAYGGTGGVYANFLRLGPVKLGADAVASSSTAPMRPLPGMTCGAS